MQRINDSPFSALVIAIVALVGCRDAAGPGTDMVDPTLDAHRRRTYDGPRVVSITDLGTLGGRSSSATGINDRGQVVGQAQSPVFGETHAFLWSEGEGMIDLGTLGGSLSAATAINNRGEVVGWSHTDPRASATHRANSPAATRSA